MNKREKNKQLCEKYPFLIPHNLWNSKVVGEYNYEYTWLDFMPPGWKKAFGEQMVEEITNALGNAMEIYRIYDVKERRGRLQWSDSIASLKIENIKEKYEEISTLTCSICGQPGTLGTYGWVALVCDKHKDM